MVRIRRLAGTLQAKAIQTTTKSLTIGSLTSEANSGNIIARSAWNKFIVLTSTFTTTFTAQLGENILKLFELMRQNPTRTIGDFGTDPAIMRALGLTGCYLYYEVRDASGAWVRASSSMTLAELVLTHAEIRIGDPALKDEKISDYKNWLNQEFNGDQSNNVKKVQNLFDANDFHTTVPTSRPSDLLKLDYLYFDLYGLIPFYIANPNSNPNIQSWISKEGLIIKNTHESRIDHLFRHLDQLSQEEYLFHKPKHTQFLIGCSDLIETQQKLIKSLDLIFKKIKSEYGYHPTPITYEIRPSNPLMQQLIDNKLFKTGDLGITTIYSNDFPISYFPAVTKLIFVVRNYDNIQGQADMITFYAE